MTTQFDAPKFRPRQGHSRAGTKGIARRRSWLRGAAAFAVGVAPLALPFAESQSASAGASAGATSYYYGVTRHVYYGAHQWQDSGWFTSHDYWADGHGFLQTESGYATITKSAIRPTVSGHGVSLSVSIAYPGQLGAGFGAGGGKCDLGEYEADGSSVTVTNVGRICDISSHVAVYGGDAHVTGKTLFDSTHWVTFGA